MCMLNFPPSHPVIPRLYIFLRETQGQRIYKLKSYDFIHVSENQITDSIEKL